jgi:hypothetical protein
VTPSLPLWNEIPRAPGPGSVPVRAFPLAGIASPTLLSDNCRGPEAGTEDYIPYRRPIMDTQQTPKDPASEQTPPPEIQVAEAILRNKDLIDTVAKILSMIGLVFGSIWVIYTFNYQRANEFNRQMTEQENRDMEHLAKLQMTITPRVEDYTSGRKLVTVRIDFKNVGIDRIRSSDEGCKIVVWKMLDQETDRLIDLSKKRRIDERNMFEHYESWVLKPGVEFHEWEAMVLESGLYMIRVRFFGRVETLSEWSLVRVP